MDKNEARDAAPPLEAGAERADVAAEGRIRVSAREIREADLPAVAVLLAKGFDYDPAYFARLLARLKDHATPRGYPKYGYLLSAHDAVVGAILLIFSEIETPDGSRIRCHVTSWYVEPYYRGYASLFFSRALKDKRVTYVNISALPSAQRFLSVHGFAKYTRGQFIAIPVLQRKAAKTRIIPGEATPPVPFDPRDQALLRQHAAYGCIALWAVTAERAYPFVFRSFLTGRLLPGAQLIYASDIASFVRFARAIGAYLALRGKFVVRIDATGPVRGLIGRFFDGHQPRWYKGEKPPAAGDLLYTQLAMCGERPARRFTLSAPKPL